MVKTWFVHTANGADGFESHSRPSKATGSKGSRVGQSDSLKTTLRRAVVTFAPVSIRGQRRV
mgnify:CR=1 FL=1